MRTNGLTAAIIVALLALAGAAPASAATCGTIERQGEMGTERVAVSADGVDCETARRVLSDQTAAASDGWDCHSAGLVAECTRGSARVSYGPARTRGSWRLCGNVAFTPNSGDLASDIRARRVSCATARSIVRKVRRGQTRPNGFRCSKSTDFSGVMPVTERSCRRGEARIRWTT